MSKKRRVFEIGRNGPRAVAIVILIAFAASGAHGAVIERLDRGETLKIAAIGTSLTDPGVSAWFAQMGAWLSAEYPGQVSLSNRAVSGTASVNLPEFDRPHGGPWQLNQVLTYDNPDVLFIEFATNDAATLFDISVDESRANLRSLITTANAWAANKGKPLEIIVQTMNNVRPDLDSYDDVGPYYQAWREEAASNGALVIDNYSNWLDLYNSEPNHATWNFYVPDGLHPTALGSANVILPEIQRVLTAQAPEPPMLGLASLGLVWLLLYRWRKTAAQPSTESESRFRAIGY